MGLGLSDRKRQLSMARAKLRNPTVLILGTIISFSFTSLYSTYV